MEAENYYLINVETGKLNIYTTKEFYDNLPEQQRKDIKNFCLWSRNTGCWISKGKAQNCYYLIGRLKEMNFENRGTTGEKISFQQQIERQRHKAGIRAEKAEQRAEKAEKKSEQLYNRAKNMASAIPLGQPILIGHHSEKRDRNYRDRIHNTFGKAFKEQDKTSYYRNKAATAKQTAEGEKYHNPKYLLQRIKECEKYIRLFERRLKGKLYPGLPEREISAESRPFYESKLDEENEKLAFYNKCLDETGFQRQQPVHSNRSKKSKHV